MIINKTDSILNKTDTKKTGKASSSGGGFAAYLNSASGAEDNSVSSAPPASMVNSLFMLQEVDADEPRAKKQAVSDGYSALEYLDKIRVGLLCGTLSPTVLQNLEGLIAKWRRNFNDPKLAAIIDEIELRAAVELAKLEEFA